jgi:phage baseplate assembly protein W
MADGRTYGINFPFKDSLNGKYLDLSDTADEEVRSNLIHLLLSRKGSRYFLPDFGTRLYEYIFEPLDGPTFTDIEAEIRDSVEKYIPNLIINGVTITSTETEEGNDVVTNNQNVLRTVDAGTQSVSDYTAKIRVDYTITNDAFKSKDFVIINL